MRSREPLALEILNLTRDEAKDLESILVGLGIRDPSFCSFWYSAIECIADLRELGLIKYQNKSGLEITDNLHAWVGDEMDNLFGKSARKKKKSGKTLFRNTDLANRIFQSLGISLTELCKYNCNTSMIITPFFGSPNSRDQSPNDVSDIFVLMPLSPDLKPVYEDHIEKVASELKLRIKRANDLFSKDSTMTDIWNTVNQANLCIADCTGRNPNVFYELGIAHTINKPVILITQNETDVPFDLRHFPYIKYDYTPRGMIEFDNQLRNAISKVVGQDRSTIQERNDT